MIKKIARQGIKKMVSIRVIVAMACLAFTSACNPPTMDMNGSYIGTDYLWTNLELTINTQFPSTSFTGTINFSFKGSPPTPVQISGTMNQLNDVVFSFTWPDWPYEGTYDIVLKGVDQDGDSVADQLDIVTFLYNGESVGPWISSLYKQ